eukprot:3846086-Rhodomonas_salina.1
MTGDSVRAGLGRACGRSARASMQSSHRHRVTSPARASKAISTVVTLSTARPLTPQMDHELPVRVSGSTTQPEGPSLAARPEVTGSRAKFKFFWGSLA